jgi:hypothetical protein
MITAASQLSTDCASSLLLDRKFVNVRQKIVTLQEKYDRVDRLASLPRKKLHEAVPNVYERCRRELRRSSLYRGLPLALSLGSVVGCGALIFLGPVTGILPMIGFIGTVAGPVTSFSLSTCLTNRKLLTMVHEQLENEKNRLAAELQDARNELCRAESETAPSPDAQHADADAAESRQHDAGRPPSLEEDAGYIIIDGIRLKKGKEGATEIQQIQ